MSFEDIVGAWAGGKPWSPQIDDWTRRRNTALPKLLELITGFETETVSLAEFSQSLDSFSKSTPLWGFSGFSGQMFLNVLMRAADQGRLADELRIAIAQPVSEHEAEDQIDRFTVFVEETRVRAVSLGRYPPKAGYTPYLLSFFWEARDSSWPIYYPRSRRALVRHGLFREEGPLARRYVSYRREILGLRDTLDTTTWGIEVLLFQLTADEESLSEQDRVALVAVSPIPDLEVSETYDSPELAEEARRQVNVLIDELAATNERIAETRAEQIGSQRDINQYLEALSFGLDVDVARLPRLIEIAVYVSEAEAASVEEAAIKVADAFGFVIVDELPAIRRSFFRKLTARGRDLATRAELEVRMKELERALQLKELEQPQAEVNARQAEAVAYLLREVKPYTNASIRLGSIVVIKTGDDVAVNTLTPIEMLQISREPTLLADPSALLREIEPPSSE